MSEEALYKAVPCVRCKWALENRYIASAPVITTAKMDIMAATWMHKNYNKV